MSVLSTVFAYHERTKHHFHRYARSPGYLDWANQPQPFRYYHGSAETRLASDRKPRALAYDRIYEADATAPARVDFGTLADFFRYSLALTAWKQSGTSRWSLRVNPSSGNLHPTEAYVLLESTASEPDSATLYHYVPETHCLERRASFSADIWNSLMRDLPSGSFLLGLSSVIWRDVEGGSKWRRGAAEFGGAGSVKVSEGQGRCRGRSLSRSAGGLNPSGGVGVWRPAGGSSRPWSPGCGSGA